MTPRSFSRLLLGIALLLPGVSASATEQLPQLVLWAWQRPENLSFLDTKKFAVASLACRVLATGDSVRAQWRDQPLTVPPHTKMIAVVRIDTDTKHPPTLSPTQTQRIAQVICKASTFPGTQMVQIDFDAVETQRQFYKDLLSLVRAQLPKSMPISITTLASWCLYDGWIKTLPVDETVPMMFSLGRDRQKILLYFESDREFLVKSCCDSLGISLEDGEVNKLMIPAARKRKMPVRVYVFTRSAWTEKKVQALIAMLDPNQNGQDGL